MVLPPPPRIMALGGREMGWEGKGASRQWEEGDWDLGMRDSIGDTTLLRVLPAGDRGARRREWEEGE